MEINNVKDILKDLDELSNFRDKVNSRENLDYIAGIELYIKRENIFSLFKKFINEEYDKYVDLLKEVVNN